MEKLIIATRKSPLALKQTDLVIQHLKERLPDVAFDVLGLLTTGDKQKDWSLQKEGGKGLFTKEIEEALLRGDANLAMHSAKDMPTVSPPGLVVAGYPKRGDPRDVLVLREDVKEPLSIATGSPRRQAQIKAMFNNLSFEEIRGRVTTRLEKITSGLADGTILAAAGLERLGIKSLNGLIFRTFEVNEMVPAAGQGAIAVQCRLSDLHKYQHLFDSETAYAVTLERTFLSMLGGGCHVASGAYYQNGDFHMFHQAVGYRRYFIQNGLNQEGINKVIKTIIQDIKE